MIRISWIRFKFHEYDTWIWYKFHEYDTNLMNMIKIWWRQAKTLPIMTALWRRISCIWYKFDEYDTNMTQTSWIWHKFHEARQKLSWIWYKFHEYDTDLMKTGKNSPYRVCLFVLCLFYVNDFGSTGSRGRTRGVPCVYPSPELWRWLCRRDRSVEENLEIFRKVYQTNRKT